MRQVEIRELQAANRSLLRRVYAEEAAEDAASGSESQARLLALGVSAVDIAFWSCLLACKALCVSEDQAGLPKPYTKIYQNRRNSGRCMISGAVSFVFCKIQ